MTEVALTPTDFANRTMEAACSGTIAAAVGVMGAGLGLVALTPFLAPASLPMSVLGMVLARHSRNRWAMSLGILGIALAYSALVPPGNF